MYMYGLCDHEDIEDYLVVDYLVVFYHTYFIALCALRNVALHVLYAAMRQIEVHLTVILIDKSFNP